MMYLGRSCRTSGIYLYIKVPVVPYLVVVACFNSAFLHQPFSSLPTSLPPILSHSFNNEDLYRLIFRSSRYVSNISELKLIAHSLAASKGNAASFFQVSLG